MFTSALVQGLETGEADRDQDGLVGLDELYDYVYDKVRAATPNQTPGKWAFGMEGELYIARRSRPVTTPAPLPPELRQAIDSPLAGVRAGAVQELARCCAAAMRGWRWPPGWPWNSSPTTTAARWPLLPPPRSSRQRPYRRPHRRQTRPPTASERREHPQLPNPASSRIRRGPRPPRPKQMRSASH